MGLAWNWPAVPGLIVVALALLMAGLVYLSQPQRPQNRFLAAFFLLSALGFGTTMGPRMLLLGPDVTDIIYGLGIATFALFPLTWAAYTLFVTTIDSPLTARLRTVPARVAIAAPFILLAFMVALWPNAWIEGLLPWRHVEGWQYDSAWAANAWFWVPPALELFGTAVAITAYRRARSAMHRRQLGWYAAAFISFDVLSIAWYLLLNLSINRHDTGPFIERFYFVLAALPYVVLTVLLGYGILATQLFDIDLKIKWTLRQGTVAAAFVAAFFIVSELAQVAFAGAIGPILGVVAAGLLVFALAPLQRVAERVSNAAMPGVQHTPEYLVHRKFEVYRHALEGISTDGRITPKERAVLEELQRDLGIAAGDAQAMERDVLSAAAGGL